MNRIEQELFDLEDYLRRNDDIADNSAYITIIDIANKVSELDAENAKLRDLVRDMWRFTGTACKKYPRLFDPAAQGGQMVNLNMIDDFEQRVNEMEQGVDK